MGPGDFVEPASLDAAVHALVEAGDEARVVAGGTALVLFVRQGVYRPRLLVSLARLGLDGLVPNTTGLTIGAMTTIQALVTAPVVRDHFPALAEAARDVATVRIRHQATLGGNLCHADPHSDPPPVLIGLGAHATLCGPAGERTVSLDDFLVGYYETALSPGEILVRLHIPWCRPGSGSAYRRATALSADDWPCAGVAAFVRVREGRVETASLVVSAVGPRPERIAGIADMARGERPTEALLGALADRAARSVEPEDDLRGPGWYKRRLITLLAREALAEAVRRAGDAL